MKCNYRSLLLAAVALSSLPVAAQQLLSAPLPTRPVPGVIPDTPTGRADYMLERLMPHMMPDPNAVDQVAEQNVTREINISKSAGQVLRPVGFVQIGNKRTIYASEDGQRVMRLAAGSQIGIMKIKEITENGVAYRAGSRDLFAPLSYLPSEPPKPPTQNTSVQQQPTGQTAPGGR